MPMFAGFFGFLITLAVLSALAYLIFRAIKKRGGFEGLRFDQPPGPRPADPLSVLDDRLARGDIDVEDYRARRSALIDGGLSSHNPGPVEPPPPPPPPRQRRKSDAPEAPEG